MYCIVSPFSKTFDEVGLIYFIPDFLSVDIKLGVLVEIPIGSKIEDGIVLSFINKEDIKFDISKIKSIINIKNKDILIGNYRLDLVKWIAIFYFSSIHNSLNLFLPKNIRNKLEKDKLNLEKKEEIKYNFLNNKILSTEQEKAYNKIVSSKLNKVLLYGITGSGKTEIYIKLIKDNLENLKQSLILIPEIILTNQIYDKLKSVFGDEITIINSSITDSKKEKAWVSISNCESKIIIGTRSAIFYPYNNLGLIIIDEEHDNSYISDKTPRYNTIEIAEYISDNLGIKLLMGSGTPQIKSMYKAIKGKYELVNLLGKFRN